MRSKKHAGVGITGLALVLTICAPAFAKDTRKVHLTYDASLNGKHLKEGTYKVQWESHSPQVTVTFYEGKNAVATAEGHWAERNFTPPTNAFVFDTGSDGARTLIEFQPAGSKQAIVFSEGTSTSQATESKSPTS